MSPFIALSFKAFFVCILCSALTYNLKCVRRISCIGQRKHASAAESYCSIRHRKNHPYRFAVISLRARVRACIGSIRLHVRKPALFVHKSSVAL